MGATLILASVSPRRRELLAASGVQFDIVPSTVAEIPQAGESPEAFAQRIAREKACDVARRRPGECVLAADTVVIAGANLFGKPKDRGDARRMLLALSGSTHHVLTAVALVDADGRMAEMAVKSEVEFRRLTAGEIEDYLDSGEPFDKAGGYAIQGLARKFATQVRGSYSNVIGLPMDEVLALLRRHCGSAMAARTAP
ncbi:MAG: Maf family protein [Candidatus Binatia bacterium]|jgi:septum formation protein